MNGIFIEDKRLGIRLPHLDKPWEDYSPNEQEAILLEWETIRGLIPDRIAELEREINKNKTNSAKKRISRARASSMLTSPNSLRSSTICGFGIALLHPFHRRHGKNAGRKTITPHNK